MINLNTLIKAKFARYSVQSEITNIFTAFPFHFFVLAIALFIYYTFVPAGTEARQK